MINKTGWVEKNPFRENKAWGGCKEVRFDPSVNNNNIKIGTYYYYR